MNFPGVRQSDHDVLDLDIATEISSLEAAGVALGVEWGKGTTSAVGHRHRPAGMPALSPAVPGPDSGVSLGYGSRGSTGRGGQENANRTAVAGSNTMLALAQNSSRAARNGREQQRAQKISDVIDKLKGMLDKANFTSGDSSSKLHVLTNCESYLRNLRDRTKCCEMEAKLRLAARRHQSAQDWAGAAAGSDIDWPKATGELLPSDEAQSVETDKGDASVTGQGNESSSAGETGPFDGVRQSASSAESATGSSVEEDGDTGSTDSGGADTSAGATDSGSQGFTTDTGSREYTADSSYGDAAFGGDVGSADSGDTGSGDAGSADGGSEESEVGASRARMRVVNYFDIFRLSNVPMAIADKSGTLVDVNDAMRGFGRISDETVKALTVQSLVAAESSKALEDAMAQMLSSAGAPRQLQGVPQAASEPFLANADIGDRPTHLTLSLVHDEHGEASAFHVALIPRTQQDSVDRSHRVSGEYHSEPPRVVRKEVKRLEVPAKVGNGAGKRTNARFWEGSGRSKFQKRSSRGGR